MKYLTKEELQVLSKDELDEYAKAMTAYQMKILGIMDMWVDAYNNTSDEYDRRKPKSRSLVFTNDSTTKH